MKNKLKIVLACSLEERLLQQMEKIKNYGFNPDNSDIYLVHSFQNQVYSDGLQSFVYPYPAEAEKIENSVKKNLTQWKSKFFPEYKSATEIHVECLFSVNPKEEMIHFLKKIKADLVVTATEGKKGISGFFHSSFTDYLVKYSSCDIVVLRPH